MSFVRELDAQGLIKMEAIFAELIDDWLKKPKMDMNISDMALDETMEINDCTIQEANVSEVNRNPVHIFLCKYLHARALQNL
jgi:hypothetical protein